MVNVVRRNARAILIDGDDLVLIKRTKPGREPYWVTVGGGVDPEDPSVEDALRREVFEELGGDAVDPVQVYVLTEPKDGGIVVQHFFLCRLHGMDLSRRTGAEFGRPERGGYEVVRVPFTREGIRGIDLMPPELADYLAANAEGLLSLFNTRVTRS